MLEAVIWGRYLQSEGILDHCVSEWPFLDQFLFFKFTSYFPSKSSTADATVDIDISSSSSSEDDFSMAGGKRVSRGSISELRESFTTAAALSPAQIAAKEKEFADAYESVMQKQKKHAFKAYRLPGIPGTPSSHIKSYLKRFLDLVISPVVRSLFDAPWVQL